MSADFGWLKVHFWSVAKAELRIWCGTWNLNLESYLVLLDPRPESTESVYEDDEDVGGGEDLKDE